MSELLHRCWDATSEGNYYEDPYWPIVRHWCQHHHLPLIPLRHHRRSGLTSSNLAGQQRRNTCDARLGEQRGDLANLTAVVDAFNAAGITVQLGYYPQWYWRQQGGGNLSDLANALVSSGCPDGSGYASTIYTNAGGNTGEGWAPYGGATPAAWQFTNSADIAGFIVDCNAYQGTDLRVLFGTTTPIRTPTPDEATTL
jgi:hypothetical protein